MLWWEGKELLASGGGAHRLHEGTGGVQKVGVISHFVYSAGPFCITAGAGGRGDTIYLCLALEGGWRSRLPTHCSPRN